MRKFLKTVAIIIVSVIVLFVGSAIIRGIVSRTRLRLQGFSQEEVHLTEIIKLHQEAVQRALNRDRPVFVSFSHLAEVYNEDGDTLLGYSMDGRMRESIYGKRYFFTKDKSLLWWGNISDTIDVEGRRHLRTGEGY